MCGISIAIPENYEEQELYIGHLGNLFQTVLDNKLEFTC